VLLCRCVAKVERRLYVDAAAARQEGATEARLPRVPCLTKMVSARQAAAPATAKMFCSLFIRYFCEGRAG